MKKVFILLVAMLVGASFQLVKAQNANKQYVHCLVLDKTGSMTGHPGRGIYVAEENIWDDVKNYCYGWVDGIPESSTVLFFTYDERLEGPQTFNINSKADKDAIKNAIGRTTADGQRTYIATSLQEVINYLTNNYPETDYNRGIFLITDGKDEDRACRFSDVVRTYGGWHGDYDYLYYVDLKGKIDPNDRNVIEENDGHVGNGFPIFMTMGPALPEINFHFDKTDSFEQDFIVSNGSVTQNMYFNIKIASTENKGEENGIANVAIYPSKVKLEDMNKIEEGRYRMRFRLEFMNNSQRNCDINVELEGVNEGENILTFAPEGFTIKARKTTQRVDFKPTGKTKTSTGKVKIKKNANKYKQ